MRAGMYTPMLLRTPVRSSITTIYTPLGIERGGVEGELVMGAGAVPVHRGWAGEHEQHEAEILANGGVQHRVEGDSHAGEQHGHQGKN